MPKEDDRQSIADISTGRSPGEEATSGLNVSRRELLVGGIATAVASQAKAAAGYLDVYYEDSSRAGLVVVWVEPSQRYEWRLKAINFAAPPTSDARRFVLKKTKAGWLADLFGCSFPGGFSYDLQLNFTEKPKEGSSLEFKIKRPGPNNDITLQPAHSLIDFLKVASNPSNTDKILSSAAELSGAVSKAKLADIANLLFGDAFEHGDSKDVKLCYHAERYWILRCGDKIDSGSEPAAQKSNRFSALAKAESLDLRFKEIAFSIFSERDGGIGAADALQLDPQKALKEKTSSRSRADVRALFAGDGAPPPLPDKDDNDAGRVLYALVRHNIATEKAGNFDRWSGDLSFGRKEGGDEKASLAIADDGKAFAYLGWRNSSDSEPVLALQVPATLVIGRGSGTQSRFEGTSARIWRAKDRNKLLRFTAALTPEAAPMTIQSRFGPFVVAPLPALPPRPGQAARVPAIRIGASKAKASRILSHFAAPLALERAAINVGSERLAAMLEQSGGDAGRIALRNESWLFSQLTFDEAECLFHIGGVPRQFTWPANPALVSPSSTESPQAEAIIDLGKTLNAALPVRISLSRATLLVRRPADLLALTYRFQDLVLERDADGWFVRPDRRLAAFRAAAQPLPPPQVAAACGDETPAADNPARYQLRNDPRPLLVVEFPPQHIGEQALFRRSAAEPRLPLAPLGGEPTAEQADMLRDLVRNIDLAHQPQDEQARLKVRKSVRDSQNAIGEQLTDAQAIADWNKFTVFRAEFEAAILGENAGLPGKPPRTIPADQSIYIGPAFLDPETERIARQVQRIIEAKEPPAGNLEDQLARILRNVPEVDLPAAVIQDLRRKHAKVPPEVGEEFPDNSPTNVPQDVIDPWLVERNEIKARRDALYRDFGVAKRPDGSGGARQGFYGLPKADRAKVPGLDEVHQKAIAAGPDLLPEGFYGRRNILGRVKRIAPETARIVTAQAIAATVEAFDLLNENQDLFTIPAEARVSGRSRLVFRIPADDFEGGRPEKADRPIAGAFPFTIEALTNWGAFDLAVVRRAEKVFEPLAGWARDGEADPRPHGGLRPRWARQETRDEAAKLLHQGIVRGDGWAVRSDQQRQGIGQGNCPWPLVRRGTVTAAERMSNVVSGVREPGLFETSIEIPFRLMLSPAQDAIWRTPLDLPLEAMPTDPARRIAPLWFAQLDETPGASSVRAIWSPDFRPEAFLDRDVGTPPHGPWAPWAMSRDVTTRWPYGDTEPVEGGPARAPERFRTGLDVADRHELVALSSLYGLPARGRRAPNGTLTDGSQIDPPPGFRLRFAGVEILDDQNINEKAADHSAIYRPQPIGVSEMTLTALGGSLDADTNFVPPASAKIVTTKAWDPQLKDALGESLFDALSIERWRQQTRLGRDILTEVVYKGFLFPLGHRCSLVKLTERRFVTSPGAVGNPVAYLIQRMFLRVGAPLKSYPAIGQPNGGRSWPPERVEILTRVTPDILDPSDTVPTATSATEERPNGRIFLRDGGATIRPGMVFWPRVRARKGGEIKFELQIDGRGSRTRMPLIFVDNTAANDAAAMEALTDFYNKLSITDPVDDRCELAHGGDKRKYAPETEPDGTSFETRTWIVAAEGQQRKIPSFIDKNRRIKFDNRKFDFGALLQGVDQPPFFPRMYKASARIAQVDRFVGSVTEAIEIFYDQEYRAFGFPPLGDLEKALGDASQARAKTDVYLDFATVVSLDPERNGERSGGALRPNTQLVALSRSRGPVGNNDQSKALLAPTDPDQSVPRSTGLDEPNPKTFFSGATLLGIVDLGDALKFATNTLSDTPQFKEVTEYTSVLLKELTDGQAAAVAKVRDQLLVPLRGALLTLAQEFHRATAEVGATFNEDQAVGRLDKLYPDVGKAYRDLQQALDSAIASTRTDRDVEALLAHFATIYAAGRRFIQAIDRVASDPIAPVREALRDAFNKQISGLIGQLQTYVEPLATVLKTIAANVDAKIRTLVTAEVFRPWRRLLFALPGPHALDATTQAVYGDAVRKAVDEALAAALPADTLVDEFLKGPDSFAVYAGSGFELAFEAAIRSEPDQKIRTALITTRDAWMFGANSSVDAIKGLLFDSGVTVGVPPELAVTTLANLRAFLNAAINVGKAESIGGIAAALREFVTTASGLINPPIDFSASAAVDFCKSATSAFNTLFKETLNVAMPLFPGIDTARTDVEAAFDTAIREIGAFSPALALDAIALKRTIIESLFKPIIDARERLAFGVKALGDLANNICEDKPDKLQLDALAVAKRTRQAFVETLNDLNRSYGNAAASAVGGQARTLLARLVAGGATADAARRALVNAVAEMLEAEQVICRIARQATALRAFPGGTPLAQTKAVLVGLANALPPTASMLKTRVEDLVKVIETQTTGAALASMSALSEAVTKADTNLGGVVAALLQTNDALLQLQKVDEARTLAEGVAETIRLIGTDVIANLEQRLLSALAEFLLAGKPYLDEILSIGLGALDLIFEPLAWAQKELLTQRAIIAKEIGCSTSGAAPVFDGDLSAITLEKVCGLLVVEFFDIDDTTSGVQPRPGLSLPAGNLGIDNDYLYAEAGQLERLSDRANRNLVEVKALFEDWTSGKSSTELLAKQLSDAAAAVLSGDLKRIIDLESARRRIEEKLKEMAPSRIVLNYDLSAGLKEVSPFFLPKKDSKIKLAARATYDLLDAATPPALTATCQVDAFDINLFDVVTLGFDGAQFVSASDKGSDFNVTYRDFTLGPKAEFLKPLQSLMNPGGNGPYVRPSAKFAGIEVGYVLDLGTISVGALSFINVSITASCDLPFGKGAAQFTASIGREDRPVLLSCLPYVGGGFLTLYADAKSLIGFAASFEFGGGGAFAFGPLRGQGRISTGIYLRKISSQAIQIDGFFYAGGEAQIACFAIAASLMVRVSHRPDGTMVGSAVFTFSFSIGFAKLRYSVGVSRTIGKGFSSGAKTTRNVATAAARALLASGVVITSDAVSLLDDWREYDRYFSNDFDHDGVFE